MVQGILQLFLIGLQLSVNCLFSGRLICCSRLVCLMVDGCICKLLLLEEWIRLGKLLLFILLRCWIWWFMLCFMVVLGLIYIFINMIGIYIVKVVLIDLFVVEFFLICVSLFQGMVVVKLVLVLRCIVVGLLMKIMLGKLLLFIFFRVFVVKLLVWVRLMFVVMLLLNRLILRLLL